MDQKNKSFAAVLLGIAAGAIGALLLAPKSGQETRKTIKKKVAELSQSTKKSATKGEKKIKIISKKTVAAVKAGAESAAKEFKKD